MHLLIERKIIQAQRDGLFADFPLKGKPLTLDDDQAVPEELRMAFKILKDHGFLPPELEYRRERLRLQDLLACCRDSGERQRLQRQLNKVSLELALLVERRGLRLNEAYRQRVEDRLSGIS